MATTLSMLQSLPHALDVPIKSEYSPKEQEDESDLWLKLETEDIPGFGLTSSSFPLSHSQFYSFSTPSLYATSVASSLAPSNWSNIYNQGSQGSNYSVNTGYGNGNLTHLATGSQITTSQLPQSSVTSQRINQFGAQDIFNSLSSCLGQNIATAIEVTSPFIQSNLDNNISNITQQGTMQSQGSMPPQVYQFFAQFQQLYKNTEELIQAEEKKRKAQHKQDTNFTKRIKQTRPKVVESKGAVQCKGRNRKKGIQCRNAALMEYIGPRPIYCAEHIELDPKSLYEKCKSSYQKEIGDGKGCKEVVLKEFGLCYKHYTDAISEMLKMNDYSRALKDLQRTNQLLSQLEKDAASAKKKDGDLYQRKNKLIPKFQEMKKILSRAVSQLNPSKEDIPLHLLDDITSIDNIIINDQSTDNDEIDDSSNGQDIILNLSDEGITTNINDINASMNFSSQIENFRC